MTGLGYYLGLLHNPTRLRAFRAGIEAAVRPGDTVLDLGTGLGTYAFFAARAGARHVVAVERARVVRVARAMAVANGLADRITFIEGEVPGAQLPTGVDVVVFEDFTTSFLEGVTWDILTAAVESLAPGGRVVPMAARLVLAPVSSEKAWASSLPPRDEGEDPLELDWTALRTLAANTPRQVALAPAHLLAPPQASDPIPLLPVPGAEQLKVEAAWVTREPSTVHGLAFWFDLEVAPGLWLSNQPSPTPEPWQQLFLPLDPPLEVPAGTRVEAAAWREGSPEGRPEWMVWTITAGAERRQGHEFAGVPLDLDDLGLSRHPEPAARELSVDPPSTVHET